MNHFDKHIFGRPVIVLIIVAYKVVWGLTEGVLGTLLIFSNRLITAELLEDPQDLFANWLLKSAHFDVSTAARFGGVLIFLGALKFLLAAGVWFGSWRARRYLIVFLCLVTAYATIDLIFHFTALRGFTLISDLAILVYLYKFLPYHLKHSVAGVAK